MERSIRIMIEEIARILEGSLLCAYLYGSAAAGDFRPGWSDIDILCLAENSFRREQAEALVGLRQALGAEHPDNPYFRLFEGAILPLRAFHERAPDTVVYWGTSGQRILDAYAFNGLSMYELTHNGVLLHGKDIRDQFPEPSKEELIADVRVHCEVIRKYAIITERKLYSAGWLLDIARGLYTLQTGSVISKTEAGEWALEQGLCPVPDSLERAVRVRKNPPAYKDDAATGDWLERLGPDIQAFAGVLEAWLERA